MKIKYELQISTADTYHSINNSTKIASSERSFSGLKGIQTNWDLYSPKVV